MSNLFLTTSVAGQPSSILTTATTSSIGYGTNGALTINSTAGVTFCNSGGNPLGASISGTGVLNCSGLTINGPLTCTSLIAPNAMIFNSLLTCNIGLKISDNYMLQVGNISTTNIQKNGTARLDYNVSTGMTHSMRVNNSEILQIGNTIYSNAGIVMNNNSVYLGSGAMYMNSTATAYIYTPDPYNITYFRNNYSNGRLSLGVANGGMLFVNPTGVSIGGDNPTGPMLTIGILNNIPGRIHFYYNWSIWGNNGGNFNFHYGNYPDSLTQSPNVSITPAGVINSNGVLSSSSVKTTQHGFTMNEGSYTYIMNVHYSDGGLYITRASDATAASATSIFTTHNGIIYWARGSSGWSYSSDKRLKKNIEYLNSCLDSVLLLKPCTFRYNGSNDDSKLNYGFIAQDVQEIYPDIISTSGLNDEKFLGLSMTDIIPILTKAVQELNTKIDDQSSEIVQLSSQNAAMNVEVTSLTSQVATLTTQVSNMAAEMDALIARVNLLISNHSDPADPAST